MRIALYSFLLILITNTVIAASKPIVKAKSVGKQGALYSTAPISLDTLSLPKDYKGHNLRDLYFALLKRENILKRDEFETEADFIERVESEDKKNKPLLGKTLGINDIYAFSLKPEYITYNPDELRFTLTIEIKPIMENDVLNNYVLGIHGPVRILKHSSYLGTNAFGATSNIEKSYVDIPVLAFYKEVVFQSDNVTLNSSLGGLYNLNINLPHIPPAIARQIKDNLTILVLFNLKEPYNSLGKFNIKPTFDKPEDITMDLLNVYSSPIEIWVYNKASGEVLSKTKISVHE